MEKLQMSLDECNAIVDEMMGIIGRIGPDKPADVTLTMLANSIIMLYKLGGFSAPQLDDICKQVIAQAAMSAAIMHTMPEAVQ